MTERNKNDIIDGNIHLLNSCKILLSNIPRTSIDDASFGYLNGIKHLIEELIDKQEKTKNELFR